MFFTFSAIPIVLYTDDGVGNGDGGDGVGVGAIGFCVGRGVVYSVILGLILGCDGTGFH